MIEENSSPTGNWIFSHIILTLLVKVVWNSAAFRGYRHISVKKEGKPAYFRVTHGKDFIVFFLDFFFGKNLTFRQQQFDNNVSCRLVSASHIACEDLLF